jgi:hypothetical protein
MASAREKERGGALHLCNREGSGRVTSFLTSSSVTPPLTALGLGDVGRLSEASLEALETANERRGERRGRREAPDVVE